MTEPSLPAINLIYARAANGVIGKDGAMPWHIPADLKRFKALTMGTPMIMGRKTFESLPGLLPGRRHIVLSRSPNWTSDGAELAHSLQEALAKASRDDDTAAVSIVGGAAIYEAFMPMAQRIELTQIHTEFAGDTYMPAPDQDWQEVAREDSAAQEDRPAYSWITFERAQGVN